MAVGNIEKRLLAVEALHDAYGCALFTLIHHAYPAKETKRKARDETCAMLEGLYDKLAPGNRYAAQRLQVAVDEVERVFSG